MPNPLTYHLSGWQLFSFVGAFAVAMAAQLAPDSGDGLCMTVGPGWLGCLICGGGVRLDRRGRADMITGVLGWGRRGFWRPVYVGRFM